MRAARTVFGRSGFAASRVADIAAEAGMSSGAFYRYYADKREALVELLTGLLQGLFEQSRAKWNPADAVESVVITTERYFRYYADNADLFRVLHETAQTDPEIEAMQAESRRGFHDRIIRMARRGIERGVLRPDLDPELSAAFLGGMTEHYAYTRFVLRRYPDRDITEVSRELTAFWARGALA
nr:TetR/AcrR family transcriptional regulator [Saccharopolyspora hordei]